VLKPVLTSITLNSTRIELPHGVVAVFVGPNNSGKSLALRELERQLINGATQVLSVTAIEAAKTGTVEELLDWLKSTTETRIDPASGKFYRRYANQIHFRDAARWWQQGPPFQSLGSFFSLAVGPGVNGH
jgi:predicted ATPase